FRRKGDSGHSVFPVKCHSHRIKRIQSSVRDNLLFVLYIPEKSKLIHTEDNAAFSLIQKPLGGSSFKKRNCSLSENRREGKKAARPSLMNPFHHPYQPMQIFFPFSSLKNKNRIQIHVRYLYVPFFHTGK